MWTLKKNKKNHEVTWQSLFIIDNNLNSVSKKDQIEQNWWKFGPIWAQGQNYDWFDKTWRKLGQKKYFNLSFISKLLNHFQYFYPYFLLIFF